MKKLLSIILCIFTISTFISCGEEYTDVQTKIIKQFEEGISDIEKAKEYAKKEDHKSKASYSDMAFECFLDILDITKDGDVLVTEMDKVEYIYYYEHRASDKMVDIYKDYNFILDASHEFNESEWDEYIDKLKEEVEIYKQDCQQKNRK